jgi:hypothetical protein
MVGGFLGTLIGLERAIGFAKPWAHVVPACSAAGAIVLVFGPPGPTGPLLITVASGVVVPMFVAMLRREPSLFTITMTVGAVAWLIGNARWLAGDAIYRVAFWWITFVVLTIAAERLELNRALRLPPRARIGFAVIAAVILTGAIVVSVAPTIGTRLIGAGLVTLTWWLAQYDVAKRTVRQSGVTRFMAACLLLGYAWLGVSGLLLLTAATTTPGPTYDAILHAIFLGFVVSMIFGHAAIVFPAITGAPLPYQPAAYLPLAVLHASVVLRVTGDLLDSLGRLRPWGGLLNATAILLFLANTARSVATARARAMRTAVD